jgi:hypothetical protein
MSWLPLPKRAEISSLRHDLSDRQDRPLPGAIRLYNIHERLVALEKVL